MVAKLNLTRTQLPKPPLDLGHRGLVILLEQLEHLVRHPVHVARLVVVGVSKRQRVPIDEDMLVRTGELVFMRQPRPAEEPRLHRRAGQMTGRHMIIVRAVVHHRLPVRRLQPFHHYETQPLPTIFAWFAAKFPPVLQQASTAMVFVIELALPFLIFGPRRLKQVAAFGFISLQLLIFFTGNYTFFNLLAIALCLFLLDDAFFARKKYIPVPPAWSNRFVSAALVVLIMTASGIQLTQMFGAPRTELDTVLQIEEPFGIVNQYGLFAVMTTTRPEIEIQGSNDGRNWQPYLFRYKAGPLNRAPRLGCPVPAAPRLADVVRRPRQLPRKPLVRALYPATAAGVEPGSGR